MDIIDLHLYLHLILVVDGRPSFITPEIKEELEGFLTEMVEENEHKIHAISCMPDHTHILISCNPNISVEDLVVEVTGLSKYFILHRQWMKSFEWQDGYMAFSCSESEVPALIHSLHHQTEFHKTNSFKEEFFSLLEENGLEFRQDDSFEFYG